MIIGNKIRKAVIIIVMTLVFATVVGGTVVKNTKLGLDLQGGIEILYKVEPVDKGKVNQDLIDSTIDTLNLRINSFGVSETSIVQEGKNLIRIQVPGLEEDNNTRELLGSAAVLTFRDSSDNLLMTSSVLKTGKASLTTDELGKPAVSLPIADNALFSSTTQTISQSEDKLMVIWLDFEEGVDTYKAESSVCGSAGSRCISAATVRQALSGDAIISGDFTQDEAKTLVGLINSGSLPVKLVEEYSTSVPPSFGDDALLASIKAGILGFILIALFMVLKYRVAGVVSSLLLLFYTSLVFVVFYVLGGVLTLPGIAALLLGIGMTVDANVITYERIKDELRINPNLALAYEGGNKKSFLTIIDSNVTTLIIAVILFIFGETAIKGFATMLIINIVLTIIVTVLFTRYILRLLVSSRKFDNNSLTFINFHEDTSITSKIKSVDYVKNSKVFFSISALIIVAGLIYGQVKGYNLSIDFASGTSINANIDKAESEKLEKYLDDKYKVVDAKYIDNNKLSVIRLSDSLTQKQINEVTSQIETEYKGDVNIRKVSPIVGDKLVKNAVYSLVIAFAAIVLYITVRFRSSFAFASVVATLHDLLIMLAIFAVFRLSVSSNFIAALLAILGYSINDTIVLFDRIRSNINDYADKTVIHKKGKDKNKAGKIITASELKEIVNRSAKETVSRSISTSFTTLLPVIALIVIGSREILDFNIAIAIGIVFGTYSSIFIAAQVWLIFVKKGYRVGNKENGWFTVDESTNV